MRPIRRVCRSVPWLIVPLVVQMAWSQSDCDLNKDGKTDILDSQAAIAMKLGAVPCTAMVNGPNVCDDTVVRRVTAAALGGACVVTHFVQLKWGPPNTTYPVDGYNAYRADGLTGTYVKLNALLLVNTFSIVDYNVEAGRTYYYTASAVYDGGATECKAVPISATIPYP